MIDEDSARAAALQEYEFQSTEALARVSYQVDYSKMLLNGLMLGNGGAIIGLLTFIGNTGSDVDPSRMKMAFAYYAGGLALVFTAYIGAFFSQYFYYTASQMLAWNAQAVAAGSNPENSIDDAVKYGGISMGLGVVCSLLSLVAFIAGSISALNSLT